MTDHTYGAWEKQREVDPETCSPHNWYADRLSNERVCVRCSTREPLPPRKIHETAVIGGPAQWRGHTTVFPVDIHPTATVGPLTQIDAGCERPTIIGAYTQVMGHVHVGHGVQIGRGCDIASGTVIAGEATLQDFIRVGIGALISPFVTIGDGARIGAGAVVVEDVPAGEVWVGNPAHKLRVLNSRELLWMMRTAQETAAWESAS